MCRILMLSWCIQQMLFSEKFDALIERSMLYVINNLIVIFWWVQICEFRHIKNLPFEFVGGENDFFFISCVMYCLSFSQNSFFSVIDVFFSSFHGNCFFMLTMIVDRFERCYIAFFFCDEILNKSNLFFSRWLCLKHQLNDKMTDLKQSCFFSCRIFLNRRIFLLTSFVFFVWNKLFLM